MGEMRVCQQCADTETLLLGFLLSSETNRPGPCKAPSVVSAVFKMEEDVFDSLNGVKASTLLVRC